jgi:hypothetical protein
MVHSHNNVTSGTLFSKVTMNVSANDCPGCVHDLQSPAKNQTSEKVNTL